MACFDALATAQSVKPHLQPGSTRQLRRLSGIFGSRRLDREVVAAVTNEDRKVNLAQCLDREGELGMVPEIYRRRVRSSHNPRFLWLCHLNPVIMPHARHVPHHPQAFSGRSPRPGHGSGSGSGSGTAYLTLHHG